MIALVARIQPKAGSEAELERVMSELVAKVRENEPGCELYTLCRDEQGRFAMIEIYRDEEALKAHGASDHFRSLGRQMGPYMDGAPEIERLQVLT